MVVSAKRVYTNIEEKARMCIAIWRISGPVYNHDNTVPISKGLA